MPVDLEVASETMNVEKYGPSFRARTIVTLFLLVLYPAVVSCSPVLRTLEGSRDRREKYGHRSTKGRTWHSPRSLLGEKIDGVHEEGQAESAGAGVDAKEAPSGPDTVVEAEEKSSDVNDDRPSGEESNDPTAQSTNKESRSHAEAQESTTGKEDSDDSSERARAAGKPKPTKESKSSVEEDSKSSEEPESKWSTFLSWIGFNSDAKHAEDIQESSSQGSHSSSTREQDVTSRGSRKRGGVRHKINANNDEGDATLRDMADYLNEKERNRSLRKERPQSFDDASDETPFTSGKEGSYPELPEKKRHSTEQSTSSTDPMSSIRDSSSGEDNVGDWMLDHGGLSDIDVRESVRMFARLFAAIDKRLNGHTDEDIHNTHSPSVRTLHTPERTRAWGSQTRSHSAWSSPHFQTRGAL